MTNKKKQKSGYAREEEDYQNHKNVKQTNEDKTWQIAETEEIKRW